MRGDVDRLPSPHQVRGHEQRGARQTSAVHPGRLGERVGRLSYAELRELDEALRTVLDLPGPA